MSWFRSVGRYPRVTRRRGERAAARGCAEGGAVKRHVLILLAVITALLAWSPVASAGQTTVRYGPYTIPAGTMTDPGMVHNKLQFAVSRPCSDCFITKFKPDLVYADGSKATMDQGPMLHHAVWTSQWRSDATCGSSWLGLAGERFFASGNERTAISLPP